MLTTIIDVELSLPELGLACEGELGIARMIADERTNITAWPGAVFVPREAEHPSLVAEWAIERMAGDYQCLARIELGCLHIDGKVADTVAVLGMVIAAQDPAAAALICLRWG